MTALNARLEKFPEMPLMDHQSALYSYFNRASAMQFFAQQSMMSSWPFHPTFFSGWPMTAPIPFSSPTGEFMAASQTAEAYPLRSESSEVKSEVKITNFSPQSGSDSPTSHMNDSVEMKKVFDAKHSTKSKIFECKVCNKVFGYKHVLQNHEKVHTGEKSYRCPKCDKCFRRDHHLKVHMRLHSGEKPYVCTFPSCDRQFVQVANLRRHLKTHENASNIKLHEKFLKSADSISTNSYPSESSIESLDLRKKSDREIFKYTAYNGPLDLRFESPEQSEPEDLSTKHFVSN